MEEEEVKVLGMWLSPYSYRVIWSLKLKGIPFEYIEQDLSNKSSLLLQSNPIYKKIPVLIHGGKPICESSVILEYIEQVWPHIPLFPTDPYQRAIARFWLKFSDDKGSIVWKIYEAKGEEERKKVIEESLEMLKMIEEHEDGIGDKKFFGGDRISVVDLAFGGLAYWQGMVQQILGTTLIDPHNFPRLHAWINRFKQVPQIKQNYPDLNRLFMFKRQT